MQSIMIENASKVVLTFRTDDGARHDDLMVVAYDENGERIEHVFVGLRISGNGKAVMMPSHKKEK